MDYYAGIDVSLKESSVWAPTCSVNGFGSASGKQIGSDGST
ncbi:hypothetical protein QLQ09_01110 [Brucella sp. NM4]|nr:hypothetical protein [Brucella sp. NM4]WHS30216.1 hypothetical protein QLQ09_01110 [Brucella sp. NM4]WHT44300.1 hypothetical protein QLQ11_20940 [Ochrobactrum sp. SSR]